MSRCVSGNVGDTYVLKRVLWALAIGGKAQDMLVGRSEGEG